MSDNSYKVCSASECESNGQPLPISAFGKHSGSKDGKNYICKQCAAYRARKSAAKNREKSRETSRQYYYDNVEYCSQRRKKYYEENKEQENLNSRSYYAENQDEILARMAEYRKNNQDYFRNWKKENKFKVKQQEYQRRANISEAEGEHSAEELEAMLLDQDCLCAYCEVLLEDDFHVDHMTALSRGGRNDWTNLAISCGPCNLSKSTKSAEEFMNSLLQRSCV